MHPGAASGGAALENFFGAGIVGGDTLAGFSGDIFHAASEEGVAHFGVIGIPVDFSGELRRATGIGRMHKLDILQMVHAGAIGGGGDGFGDMGIGGQTELVEGGEEMIVTRFVARAPIAHGPGVNHLAVEDVIDVAATGGGFGGVGFTGVTGRSEQVRRCAVDAQVARGGEIDEIFGVDGTVEMVVQISALGHDRAGRPEAVPAACERSRGNGRCAAPGSGQPANEARNRSSRQWRITVRVAGSGINPPGGTFSVRKGIVNGWGGRSGGKKWGRVQGLKPSLIWKS